MVSLLAQADDSTGALVGGGLALLVYVALLALMLVSFWVVFTKMGQSGWGGIIPILNWVVIAKLGGREWWWGLLTIIPCIGFVVLIILWNDLAKLFGKGVGWTIGLIFLPFVFVPMLAFGSAQYQGPTEKVV